MYAHKPPQIDGTRQVKLKDWGAPAIEDEIFRLSDLPEFSSTDFTVAKASTRSAPPPGDIPPAKKRKVENPSLHQLIPQVEYIVFPLFQRDLIELSLTFYLHPRMCPSVSLTFRCTRNLNQ